MISQQFKNNTLDIIRLLRAAIIRTVIPKKRYLNSKSLKPISYKYGFDRGKPIDRFFIEQFLEENKNYVKGRCLEIVDSKYTKMFGGEKVIKSDVLDIFPTKKANIHGDLRNLTQVKGNVYDCLIVTQTLNVIDDYDAAIKECIRILRPGGVLLVTMPTISPCWNLKINLWRLTQKGAQYIFSKYFIRKNLFIKGYGNLRTAKAFWIGLSVEDMSTLDLLDKDYIFPLIIGVRAIKEKKERYGQ